MRNFAAQLSHNLFSKTESDKVTEMTLNKDTATSGLTTCFLLNQGAVKPLKINTSYRASSLAISMSSAFTIRNHTYTRA